MTPRKTTVGQILVNSALPKELQDYTRVFDKKSIDKFLTKIGQQVEPDQFAEIVKRLTIIGLRSARGSRKASFRLSDFKPPKERDEIINKLRLEVQKVIRTEKDPDKRDSRIIETVSKYTDKLPEVVQKSGLKAKNPFSLQVLSGARGSTSALNSMRGADLLYQDHRERPIPIPVLKSYAEGLDPIEYWAGTYGTRSGIVAVKLATADAGYFGKRLRAAAHRQVVTDEEINPNQALAVEVDDLDNVGSVLARDYGSLKRGTPIDGRGLKYLKDRGLDEILIYSPIASGSRSGGLPRLAAGVREHGRLSNVGENIGITAAQAISEPVSQGMLSKKHAGGVSKGKQAAITGFDFIEQLVEIPKSFVGGAPVSVSDGIVGGIRPAPQGGSYVKVAGEEYYVPEGQDVTVKPGQTVEAGDALSDGIPNPRDYVKYKGVGEGRRLFTRQFTRALKNNSINAHRRNVEVVARGIVNAVKITGSNVLKGYFPDDVVSYDFLESKYKPRQDAKTGKPSTLLNHYLEAPFLHYSIGTRITPTVSKRLEKFGFNDVVVHPEQPGFAPDMQRAQQALLGDPDWMTQLGGFNLKRTFLSNVRRGASSNIHGTSWIPALATGEIKATTSGHY